MNNSKRIKIKNKINIKQEEDQKIILANDNLETSELNKAKAGLQYTQNKVKVLRPVTMANGSTFQRNYWVAPNEVKSTDVVVNEKEKQPAGNTQYSDIQKIFFGTPNKTIQVDTFPVSIIENGSNYVNEVSEKYAIDVLLLKKPENTADNIIKLALIEEKLLNQTDENIIQQLNLIKTEIEEEINIFFKNAKIVEELVPVVKYELMNKNTDLTKKPVNYSVDNYLPDWIQQNLELRTNNSIESIPEYNFKTQKLITNAKKDFHVQHIYQAIGWKIEQNVPEINSILDKFYYNRMDQEMVKSNQEEIEKAIIPNSSLILNSNSVYPMANYKEEDKSAALNAIDPILLEINNLDVTNLLSHGLCLFMNSSMLKKAFMLDPDYVLFLLGIMSSDMNNSQMMDENKKTKNVKITKPKNISAGESK